MVLEPELHRHLGRVEHALAVGGDRHRRRIHPPVHQVEMVRGFVHQEAAGLVLVAVPAAEIVGAVNAVEIPAEIHRLDLADRAGHQDVLELRARRRIAVVERHRDALARLALRIEHALEPGQIDRHRLFGDDVAARLERPHDVFVVEIIRHRDDHRVRLLLGDHLVELGGQIGGNAVARLRRRLAHRERQPLLVDVAQRDQFVAVSLWVSVTASRNI